ncbi:hypothetical protein [Endozoicomonas sp. 4G]|uniref:hypothetical protein n=1 Tax=Endozoicomonas sp. 4G TaxID=2872754 RepID=UPI002078DC75|nr:hypothetical protein [Endozoicomonas sp. 4G]
MKKSFSLFPLLLCLFYSMAQASRPSQNDFDFLKPFNDSALVANGLELTESIAGLSLSILLNQGIWWGVCKTAGVVSGLSRTHDLAASDTKELEELKTDFCLQLVPVMTTAEVALAGHVSPWPLEQHWWKPLYFAGAGMAAYAATMKKREYVPAAVLTYLASEAVSRTGASAISVLILRTMSVRNITTEWYLAGEYAVLSAISGFMAGNVAYEVLIHKGSRSAQATFASALITMIVGGLSGVISKLIINADGDGVEFGAAVGSGGSGAGAGALAGALAGASALAGALVGTEAVAGVGAAAEALSGIGVEPGAIVGVVSGAVVGVVSGALSGSVVGVVSGALSGSVSGAALGAGDVVGVGIGAGATVGAMGAVGVLLMLVSSKKTSDNRYIQAGVALTPALAFAVINSLSNHAVYGYPLEQSLSETGWTQWKKFYAPLDYLSTLFK